MKKYILFSIIVLAAWWVLSTATAQAATYWVSPTGSATWVNCSGSTPLSGTASLLSWYSPRKCGCR